MPWSAKRYDLKESIANSDFSHYPRGPKPEENIGNELQYNSRSGRSLIGMADAGLSAVRFGYLVIVFSVTSQSIPISPISELVLRCKFFHLRSSKWSSCSEFDEQRNLVRSDQGESVPSKNLRSEWAELCRDCLSCWNPILGSNEREVLVCCPPFWGRFLHLHCLRFEQFNTFLRELFISRNCGLEWLCICWYAENKSPPFSCHVM